MALKNIIILGAPGCGKGTQSALLTSHFNLFHLSSGDLLREIKTDHLSPFYHEVNNKIANGELVNDDIIQGIISQKIKFLVENNTYEGIIYDGFPRTISQAIFLNEELAKYSLEIKGIILLKVDKDIIVDRVINRFTCVNCGAIYNKITKLPLRVNVCDVCGEKESFSARIDDSSEIIINRLEVFKKNVSPIISFYKNKLIEIDAGYEPEQVFDNIKKVLEK